MNAKLIAVVCALLTSSVGANGGAAFAADDESVKFVSEGERFAAKGDWGSAAVSFSKAAQSGAWKQRALYDLGIAEYHLGDMARAMIAERAAIQLNPHYVDAYIQLATVMLRQGDSLSAMNALNKALQVEPQNQVARANLTHIKAQYVAFHPAKKVENQGAYTTAAAAKPESNRLVAPAVRARGDETRGESDVAIAVVQKMNTLPAAAATETTKSSDESKTSVANRAPAPKNPNLAKLDVLPVLGVQESASEPMHDLFVGVVQKLNTIPMANTAAPKNVAGPLVALKGFDQSETAGAKPPVSAIASPSHETFRGHGLQQSVEEPKAVAAKVAPEAQSQDTDSTKKTTAPETKPQSAAGKVDVSSYMGGLSSKANELVSKAMKQFATGSVDQAKYSLKRAINLDDSNVNAHINLGVVLGTQGDFAGDYEQQRKALLLDGKNSVVHFNLGWVFQQQQQWETSMVEYHIAAERIPEAIGGKALAMSHLGKTADAVKLLADAKKRYSNKAWPCDALAAVYIDQGAGEKAILELKQAVAREPGDIESQKRLVDACMSMKNWQVAAQAVKATINKTPYDIDAYLDLAFAQEQLKNNEDALSTLKVAMEVAPANAVTHAALSGVLERLGHATEAEDEARLALKLDPKQEIADTILQRLSPR